MQAKLRHAEITQGTNHIFFSIDAIVYEPHQLPRKEHKFRIHELNCIYMLKDSQHIAIKTTII